MDKIKDVHCRCVGAFTPCGITCKGMKNETFFFLFSHDLPGCGQGKVRMCGKVRHLTLWSKANFIFRSTCRVVDKKGQVGWEGQTLDALLIFLSIFYLKNAKKLSNKFLGQTILPNLTFSSHNMVGQYQIKTILVKRGDIACYQIMKISLG